MLKNVLLAASVMLVLDVGVAQICKFAIDDWVYVSNSERTRRVRVMRDPYHHDLRPNVDEVSSWGQAYRTRTNSLGFRDASNRVVPAKSDGKRMLLIGDSFTEGLGVDFEESYAGIICARLGREGVEVLNAGVMSYSPAIYYRKIRYLLEEVGLDFDEVVVFLDLSDVQDEAVFYSFDAQDNVRFDLADPPSWARDIFQVSSNEPSRADRMRIFLKDNSLSVHVATVVRDRIALAGKRSEPRRGIGRTRALWTTDPEVFALYGERGLARARESMDRLAKLVHERGVRLRLVVYPWPDQIWNRDRDSLQVRYWQSWAEERSVDFVNLFEPFFELGERETVVDTYFIAGDVHFNAAGNRLIAEAFLDAITGSEP